MCSEMDAKASEFIIASYNWPEPAKLNNVMKRATLLTRGKYIGAQELEKTMAQTSPPPDRSICSCTANS